MGQFNLRWNNHISNILQVFAEHLSSESLVDVTLSCEGRFIKAHKIILSACSPYFQELFQNHTSKHPVIILNGVKYEDLQSMIRFMYSGEIRIEESELTDLLAIAETLQVKGLCNVREKNEKDDVIKPSTDDIETKNGPVDSHVNDANCKLERQHQEEKDKSRPRKRRKMSHTVNELANEPIFTSPQRVCVEPEKSPSRSQENYTDTKASDDEEFKNLKKLRMKAKTRPERQTHIYGEDGPEKIRRPPNAFMIFANEWRRRLALEHPRSSNTDISVMLGSMWKNLTNETKDSYYALAKKVDEEHKRKYPGYYYSPKEARIQKNLKNDMLLARCLPKNSKDNSDNDNSKCSKGSSNDNETKQLDIRNDIDGSDMKNYLNDIEKVRDNESISLV